MPDSTSRAQCPISKHGTDSLTVRPDLPAEKDSLVQLSSFHDSRKILKDNEMLQAGFLASEVGKVRGSEHTPVLYQRDEEHAEMRRSTAKYFTPAAVESYGSMISKSADNIIGELAAKGEMNLDDLSLRFSVQVAANIIGLNSSRIAGMEKRIELFVSPKIDGAPNAKLSPSAARDAKIASAVALFFSLDVKPAIDIRRKSPKNDLISYLLERNYTNQDILTECITYATAGMITTREFITLSGYQLLKRPEMRADYVHGTEKERHAILNEILRLDPVVGMLYRKSDKPVSINGKEFSAGTNFSLNIQAANTDTEAIGENPHYLCPGREMPRGIQPHGLAFGDGSHRCPGAFLAIKETDTFLRRLLVWQDLQLVQPPTLSYNETVKGYALRGLKIRLGKGISRT